MSTYNLGALKNRVFKILQQDPFFDDDDLIEAINLGIDDLVLFSKYTREVDRSSSEVGLQEYALPDDFMCLHAVTFDGGRPMKEMTLDEWIEVNSDNITPGTPRKYMIRNNLFVSFDRPTDRRATINIFYTAKTDDLALDADDVPIKREYSDSIVLYALYWLYQQDNRMTDAANTYNLYKAARREATVELKLGTKRKIRRVVRN